MQKVSTSEIVADLLRQAVTAKASDIHFDPNEHDLKIRFRIDGLLIEQTNLPKGATDEIIARIKILASLRTDEHQQPQDGRFTTEINNASIDVRVSIAPTYYGENAVLRLLIKQKNFSQLSDLGFSSDQTTLILNSLKKTSGLILVTGPTGSGKTTTLYTLLESINTPDKAIVTIEDPVEYALPGITQIQVNPRVGLTFASGLKSILRQDPNIIMVGEIRDKETAAIAINAALTGHLVLSTLHTNSALASIPRLIDMGVDPYLLSATLNIIISQRLIRLTCTNCRKANEEVCSQCQNSRYHKRTNIAEVAAITPSMQEIIHTKTSLAELTKSATQSGFKTIMEQGLQLVDSGATTIEEVIRILHE